MLGLKLNHVNKRDPESSAATMQTMFDEQVFSWWHHRMVIPSELLALCEGNPPVTGGFHSQRANNTAFDVIFHVGLNKQLNKQKWMFHLTWDTMTLRKRHYYKFSMKNDFYTISASRNDEEMQMHFYVSENLHSWWRVNRIPNLQVKVVSGWVVEQ